MRYVIGLDGGQTSTLAVLADEEGRLLGVGRGGPANHIHEPGGEERVRRSVADAIAEAREQAGLPDAPVAFAYLGMTGGSAEMERIVRPVTPADAMELGHDSLIALYSVTYGRSGVAVIGGTGSVAFGRAADGREAMTGGWGYVMGDEGSGYWIALRALNACVRAADGLAPRTTLTERLCARLGVDDLKGLHRLVYSDALCRADMAALSAVVGEAAAAGDRAALGILRSAGRELGRLAAGVLRKLGMTTGPVPVGMAGGVFHAGEPVQAAFAAALRRANPDALPTLPRIPAAAAAALLALERLGIPVDDARVANVEGPAVEGKARRESRAC